MHRAVQKWVTGGCGQRQVASSAWRGELLPNARASPAGDECTSSQLDGFL